jgi:hypothetical protein
VKIPTQLRQCILADFVHLGSAATKCILLPFVAGTRYDWLILLRFIDKSVLLIVAPLGSPLIVDPIGIGVINHDARATRSSNFHHDASYSTGRHQPKRESNKHRRRCQRAHHPSVDSWFTTPGSVLCSVGHLSVRFRTDGLRAGIGQDRAGLRCPDRGNRGEDIGPWRRSGRRRPSCLSVSLQ